MKIKIKGVRYLALFVLFIKFKTCFKLLSSRKFLIFLLFILALLLIPYSQSTTSSETYDSETVISAGGASRITSPLYDMAATISQLVIGQINSSSFYNYLGFFHTIVRVVANNPPGTPTIDLTPDSPTTTDDLYCNITVNSTDADGDKVNYTYKWYKNSVLNLTIPYTFDTYKIMGSENTTKGETWRCNVTPFDGIVNGTSAYDEVTIQVTNVTVNLTSPLDNWYVNSTAMLECSASSDISLTNISLYHNHTGTWHLNQTQTVTGLSASVQRNLTGLTAEAFIWNCYGCDNEDSCAWAVSNYTATVDLTNPGISFVPPTPANNTINTTSYNWAYINISASDNYNNYSVTMDWNKSLVGWWRFEDYYNDSSTYDNDGSCSGTACPRLTIGMRGKAYEFDGVNDYVDCGNDESLNISNDELTLEAWIYADAVHAGEIIPKSHTEGTKTAFTLFTYHNGYLFLDIGNGTSSGRTSCVYSANTWLHIVGVYNSTNVILYMNGVQSGTPGSLTGNISPSDNTIRIGGNYNRGYFNGLIDEVKIYKRALSPEEINASYDANKYKYEHNFTNLGGIYTYKAYVQDQAGNLNETEERTFKINRLPTKVNLSYPLNNSTITNRTPRFNWTQATDPDGDTFTYQILILRESCEVIEECSTDKINVTGISNNYHTPTQTLDVDAVYNWSVRANDSTGYGSWSDIWNFTVSSLNAISMPNSSIDFGAKSLGDIDNTSDNSPNPLTVQNDGNIDLNITLYANQTLWNRSYASLNTSYFKFKADNSTELNSFNYSGSQTTWENVSSYAKHLIKQIDYNDSKDLGEIDIYIKVPDDEPPGTKKTYLWIQSYKS